MPTNESRATLVNRYASQHERLEELKRDQVKLQAEMRETIETILSDATATRVLKTTGVRVGGAFGDNKLLRFDENLANTPYPLVIEELPDIPYSFQLDEVADDE